MQYAYDLSGNFQMKSEFREVLFHTAQCMKWHLPECLEMLSSIVFEPTFTPEVHPKCFVGKLARRIPLEQVIFSHFSFFCIYFLLLLLLLFEAFVCQHAQM